MEQISSISPIYTLQCEYISTGNAQAKARNTFQIIYSLNINLVSTGILKIQGKSFALNIDMSECQWRLFRSSRLEQHENIFTDALINAPKIQSISDTLWDDLEKDLYIITLLIKFPTIY